MGIKKKAGMLDSTLGKVIIGVIVLVVIIGMIWIARGRLGELWRQFARLLRFG